MTMNSSGPISLAGTTAGVSIQIENGGNGTTMISLNDSAVRSLAGVPSGAIIMPTNFYGKSNTVTISYTFTSSTANASLNLSSALLSPGLRSGRTMEIKARLSRFSEGKAIPALTRRVSANS